MSKLLPGKNPAKTIGRKVGKAVGTGVAKGVAKGAGQAAAAARSAAHVAASGTAASARKAVRAVPEPSPNPMTNLVIADLALRGGGRLLRNAVERTVLGARYSPGKAKAIVKGRSMAQTLIGTAIARIATRSIPGALIVGGALLAKSLYDRQQDRRSAELEGEAAIEDQAERA